MTEEELDLAHDVLQSLEEVITNVGSTMIKFLTEEQKYYIINKLSDEFRFWSMR